MRLTVVLRVLLVMFLVGLLIASGLLYIISLDLAEQYPEYAPVRMPIYVAVLVGLLPVVIAVQVVFALLGVIDRGAAFSPRTIELLRRLSLLFGIAAGYLVLGLIGVWLALGRMHPSILLAWLAAEVVTLFLLTLAALLGRLVAAALEVRQRGELTVLR